MDNNAFSGSADVGRGCVFAAPDSNDWYLTTDDSVTLGPYGSCEEAVRLLGLLREHPNSPRTHSGFQPA